ncbi:MAG: hypothetical protein K0R03_1485 [Moraxellaceae bacterium]|nr:hypothetical protein [Moraxellaceae bacterium]
MRFPGGRGIGLGTLVLAVVAALFGIDPSVVMQMGSQVQGPPTAVSTGPVQESAGEAEARDLVAAVLGDTEDTWRQVFAASGRQYREPALVLFREATPTRCGTGQAAMGPFYCSLDEKIYIDLAFYDELKSRFRAPGDFAQAYVIAHEVGHHVQHLLGISDRVREMRARSGEREGNALSVRLELQADCLAGVWGHHASRSRQVLEAGDLEEALTAATAIGDDTLQKQARGFAVPDSFTHGSAAQRMHWFRVGMEAGNVSACDTFAGGP